MNVSFDRIDSSQRILTFFHIYAASAGFIIGIIVCSIMMNVIRGAVNTLIVCWADSPSRLEENHPDATKEMAETWTAVFPEARVHLASSVGLPAGSPQTASVIT